MKLSVLIPVYNEKGTIKEMLHRVKSVDLEKEIIVVDDGSTDGTSEILREIKEKDIKILSHSRNMGKGAAIRTGLKQVNGDIVIIQDADLETDPEDYHRLLEPIIRGKAQVVYGSRFLKGAKGKSFLRYLANRILTWTANILYHARITDEGTGYKALKTSLIKSLDLKSQGFDFCPEVTAKIRKKGYKIYEVPISYYPRDPRASKIYWRDGFKALFALIKYRFVD